MSPYGEMVCAGIHKCKFLMNCYLYLLLLCANYCITCFRVWQNSNIQIHFKQSFYYYYYYYYDHTFKKKKKKSSPLTGKEHSLHRAWNLSFSIAGLIYLYVKDVNSEVTCGPQNHTHKHSIVLTYPPPYFCTNYHFTKLPIYNFVFLSVVLIRILKTFRKTDELIKFALPLGYNFIFNHK